MERTTPASSPDGRLTGDTELVRLRDGSQVTLRPVVAADEPALHMFLERLRLSARRLRFFSGAVDLVNAAHMSVAAGTGRYGLVAHDETGVLVGHALFVQLDHDRAEVALEVADHLHDRGLGTILIERLALTAEERGITRFVAAVLPENREMLAVLRDGFDAQAHFSEGLEMVEFPTAAWRVAGERFDG